MTRFTVDGATLIGVGNGDPNSHESEKAPQRSLFNGLAQMLVQAGEGRGKIVTTIEPLATWYPAEEYHQEYWDGEGQRNPYCMAVIPPKLQKLRKSFAARSKAAVNA